MAGKLRLRQASPADIDLQASDDNRERALQMLVYNGAAILLSSARSVIESVTGISGFGRMHVPSVNMAELIER